MSLWKWIRAILSGTAGAPQQGESREAPSLASEALEPRVMMSATWIDADTGNELGGASEGDDVYEGDHSSATADGLDGDDRMFAHGGNDTLFGGEGDDQLFGGSGNDALHGGEGSDALFGESGNENLFGGSGDDYIDGGSGNEHIEGGEGDDVLLGGSGNESLIGGEGDDLLVGGSGNNALEGNAGDDTLLTESGNDHLIGGEGHDSIEANGGNDYIDAGEGDDQVLAGSGNDYVTSGEGDDIVLAGTGNDQVHAGDGDDTIYAGDGDDLVRAGEGDDVLVSGGGNDQLHGDEGDDTFSAEGAQHGDTISIWGGEGEDTLDLRGFGADDVTNHGDHILVDLGSGQSFRVNVHEIESILTDDGDLLSADGSPPSDSVLEPALPDWAPSADAGADFEGAGGQQVTLDGTGSSDPEGAQLTYSWQQIAGPWVELDDDSSARPSFTAPGLEQSSEVVFALVVSDGTSRRHDLVTVSLEAGSSDTAPTAEAGADQTVEELAIVQLSGSGVDSEGQDLTYQWVQTSGTPVVLDDASAAAPTFTAPEGLVNSDLVFELRVSDGTSITTDTVTITVEADDDAPVAAAGPDLAVSENEAVQLANASSDPEGQELSYEWVQLSGPTVELDDVHAATPTFTAPELGADAEIVFELRASDGEHTSTDTVRITIEADDDAPLADAGTDATVEEGETVTLDGSSSLDPEGEALTYTWVQTGGPSVTLSDPTAPQPTFEAPEVDGDTELTFELTVADGDGAVDLDGGDDYIDTGVDMSWRHDESFSLSVKLTPDTTSGRDAILGKGEGIGTYSEWEYTLMRDGDAVKFVYWTGGGSHALDLGGGALVAGEEATISVTFDADTNQAQLWVNGEVVDTDSSNGNHQNRSSSLKIGMGYTWGNTVLDGKISDVQVHNAALTADEVETVHEGGVVADDLALHYDFEGEGDDLYTDRSGNGHDGTPSGDPEGVEEGGQTAVDTVTITVTNIDTDPVPTASAGDDLTVDEGDIVTLSGDDGLEGVDAIDFDENSIDSYGGSQQDSSATVEVLDGGDTLHIEGNGWKSIEFPYEVTADTILSFDFRTESIGEIHGIGFDTDSNLSPGRTFQLAGTQPWGLTSDTYTSDGEWQHIELPVGDFYTGSFSKLFFVNDHDAGAQNGESYFSNVRVYEPGEQADSSTFQWTQLSGPAVTLDDRTAASPTFEAPEGLSNSDLVFELAVTVDGVTTTDTVTVTVNADNDAPSADAGPDQAVEEGDAVQLVGAGADPEGQALTYEWVQTSGTPVTLSDAAAPNPTFEAPEGFVNSDLVFELRVSDGESTSADTVTVTVNADNDAPVATAGPDLAVSENDEVQLANASSDPEGQELSYEWVQLSGPTVVLDDAHATTPTFTTPDLAADADIVFELRASDGEHTSTDTVTIHVAAEDDAPTADAGLDLTVTEEDLVTLQGVAHDPEGQPLTYSWTQTGGPSVALDDPSAPTPSFTAPNQLANTTLVFQLEVSDGENVSVDTVRVTVNADNDAPVTDAGAPQTVDENEGVTLQGTITEPEGQQVEFWWIQTSGPAVSLSDSDTLQPHFVAPEGLANVDLEFELHSTDGVHESVDTVTVQVNRDNDAPSAEAGPTRAGTEGDTIQLLGSGSDPESQGLTYTWTQTGGPSVELSDPHAARPTFEAVEQRENYELTFELAVSDGVNTSVDTVLVQVSADDDLPEVMAGSDQAVSELEQVQLSGFAEDPEGQPLSYSWTQVSGTPVVLDDASAAQPTFQAPEGLVNSDLVFQLTVSDGVNVVEDQVTITVQADDDAPSADAGPDQTVEENALVQLEGSGSDPEGVGLSYEWVQVSGPTVALDDTSAAAPTFTAPDLVANTDVVFELRVSDGANTTTDTVTVTINADDDAPAAEAGPLQRVSEGDVVQLAGVGSDPEDRPLTYAWTQLSGPTVELSDSDAASPTFTVQDLQGDAELVFQLEVSDGNSTSLDTVTVLVDELFTTTAGQDITVDENVLVVLDGGLVNTADFDFAQEILPVEGQPGDLFGASLDVDGTRAIVGAYGDDGTISNQGSASIYELTDDGWELSATLTVDAPSSSDQFGWQTQISGDTAIVSAYGDDTRGNYSGAVYVFQLGDNGWEQTAALVPEDLEASDMFGYSVEMQDGAVVIGSIRSDTADGVDSGAVYVFEENEDGWTQSARLQPEGQAGSYDYFGSSVAIDGDRIVVGSFGDSDSATWAGSAYVFERGGDGQWVESSHLEAPTPESIELFGSSVDIDGDRLVVGAMYDSEAAQYGGAVHVFELGDAGWELTETITPDSAETFGLFGQRVQLEGDTLVVSAPSHDGDTANSGEVSILVHGEDGWTLSRTLTPDYAGVGGDAAPDSSDSSSEQYGSAISLDGGRLFVGLPGDDSLGSSAGAVHVYDASPPELTYTWVQTGGPSVSLDDAHAEKPVFTAPERLANTDLTFELRVSDGSHTSIDSVVVHVNADDDAPSADAGPDQSVEEESSVQLAGSGVDPEAQGLSYSWVQVSGPAVHLDDTSSPTPSFDAPNLLANSDVVFELRVSDGVNTSADTVRITIHADDDAPTADAGVDQIVEELDAVQLSGSGLDPEGQGLTYQWVQTGGTPVALSDANAANPTFDAPEGLVNSDLHFELRVSDGVNTSVDSVTITVNADDDAPSAEAGPNQSVEENAPVQLSGSALDPEERPLTYSWVQVSGPSVVLEDASSSSPGFTAPDLLANTDLVFEMRVSDGVNTTTDTVTVTVQADNDAPSAEAGPDQTVDEEATVQLSGSGMDPEGQGLTYTWVQTSGPVVALDDAHAASPSFEAPNLLTNTDLEFELRVSDGVHTSIDTVRVTVNADNDAPAADAGPDRVVSENEEVTLVNTSHDPEGQALSYQWVQTGGVPVTLSDDSQPSPVFVAPEGLVNSDLVFELRATDGTHTSVDTVTITVEADNDAPSASAGLDSTVSENAQVQLDATDSSDPEGQSLSYTWTQVSGPSVVLEGADSHSPTFVAPDLVENGELVFQVEVSDGTNTSVDTVRVLVEADNDGPLVDAEALRQVLAFDGQGTDEYVSIPPSVLDGLEDFTIELDVVRASDQSEVQSILSVANAGNNNELLIYSNAEGRLTILTPGHQSVTHGSVLDVDTEHRLALVREGGVTRLFVDGELLESFNLPNAPIRAEGVVLGQEQDSVLGSFDPNQSWTGTLSGLRVSDSARWDADYTPSSLVSDDAAVATFLPGDIGSATWTDATGGAEATLHGGLVGGTFEEGSEVTLQVSASDPEGETLSYSWTQVSGPSVALDDPAGTSPTFTAPDLVANTELQFQVEVSDGTNVTTEVLTLTIGADDDAPSAAAGDDQLVQEGDVVSLAGSGSDPEGQGLTYQWIQTSGPSVELSDASSSSPTFTAPESLADTQLTFELHVSDGANTSVDTVTVNVEADNDGPLVDAGADQIVEELDRVELSGFGTDPEDQPLTYQWIQTSGPAVILDDANASAPSFTAPNLIANTDIGFELRVSDGVNTSVDTVTVTVNADNDAPSAEAGEDLVVAESTEVQLHGVGTDPEGQGLTYEWVQVSGPSVTLQGSDTSSPTFAAPDLLSNTDIRFELRVNDGVHTSVDTVTVTIQADDDAPSAFAGVDQSVPENAEVQLSGSGLDPEGQGLTYTWVQTSGPTVFLDDIHATEPTFTAPDLLANTDIGFALRVSDGVNTSVDTVLVTVQADDDAPSAQAGPDQTVEELDLVQLAGSGSDPEGVNLSYQWVQTSGPSVTLSNPSSPAPTFEAPEGLVNSDLTFELRVSDGVNTSADTVTISVNADNDAPIADAGPNQIATEDATVQLAGAASDPEGRPLTFEWIQTGGPSVTLDDATIPEPTFTAPNLAADETISFELRVSDGENVTVDTVRVTITADDDAPVLVDAGPDQTVEELELVQLDGSGADLEGQALTYQWVQTSGTPVVLTDPTASAPSFEAPEGLVNSDLSFELRVSDGTNTTTDSVTITVQADDDAPSADAGPDQAVEELDTVQLSGGGVDPEGVGLSYEWVQLSGPSVSLDDPSAAHPSFQAPERLANTDLIFELRVSDGVNTSTDTVTITVGADDDAPTLDAGPDQIVQEDEVVQLSAVAHDPEGQSLSYTWVQTGGPAVALDDVNSPSPSFTAPNIAADDVITFEARVSDGENVTVDTVRVTITADDDAPVLVDAGPDQTVEELELVQLEGSGADLEGQALTYQWVQTSGTPVVLSDPTASAPSFEAPEGLVNSDLSFELRVSDGTNTTTDSVTITVQADDDAPSADAGPDQAVEELDTVQLSGGGVDPEGVGLSYEWVQLSGPSVTLDDPSAAHPSFQAPELLSGDEIVFELRVSDGVNTSTDTVRITVAADDDAPVQVSAGEDQLGTEHDLIQLSGSGHELEGQDLSYEWIQTSGTPVQLSDPSSPTPTFEAPEGLVNSDLEFELRVSDGTHTVVDSVTITVQADDDAPSADAGAHFEVEEGHFAQLDGVGLDPEQQGLTYEWVQIGGPSVSLDSAHSPTPGFLAPERVANTDLVFELRVSDGVNTSTDTITVTVGADDDAPTADAGQPQTAPGNKTIQLEGSGLDPEGRELSFSWRQVEGPTITLFDADSRTPHFVAPPGFNGALTFELRVDDGFNTSVDTVTISVVQPPNLPENAPGDEDAAPVEDADPIELAQSQLLGAQAADFAQVEGIARDSGLSEVLGDLLELSPLPEPQDIGTEFFELLGPTTDTRGFDQVFDEVGATTLDGDEVPTLVRDDSAGPDSYTPESRDLAQEGHTTGEASSAQDSPNLFARFFGLVRGLAGTTQPGDANATDRKARDTNRRN